MYLTFRRLIIPKKCRVTVPVQPFEGGVLKNLERSQIWLAGGAGGGGGGGATSPSLIHSLTAQPAPSIPQVPTLILT